LAAVTNYLLARDFELVANGRKRLTLLFRRKGL
jgi:hypothetical protein